MPGLLAIDDDAEHDDLAGLIMRVYGLIMIFIWISTSHHNSLLHIKQVAQILALLY